MEIDRAEGREREKYPLAVDEDISDYKEMVEFLMMQWWKPQTGQRRFGSGDEDLHGMRMSHDAINGYILR